MSRSKGGGIPLPLREGLGVGYIKGEPLANKN